MRLSAVTLRMNPSMGAYVVYLNVSLLFGNMKTTDCDLVLTVIPDPQSIKTQVIHVMEEQPKKKNQNAAHPTIFHELLQGDLPEEEKNLDRLWLEGQLVVGAGTETTAWGNHPTILIY